MELSRKLLSNIYRKGYKTSTIFCLLSNENFGKCSNYKKDKIVRIDNENNQDKKEKDEKEKKKDEKPNITKPKTAKNRLPKDPREKVALTKEDLKLSSEKLIEKLLNTKELTLYDCITNIRDLNYHIKQKTGYEIKDYSFTFLDNIVNGKIIGDDEYNTIKQEIREVLINGFTEKAKDFNKKITDYCNSNQSKFFENIANIDSIDIDQFIEDRLKIHKVDNITLEYSENDLKTLLKNLYSDMTTNYFTKKGAYSLIDKIILLYSNGFIDKFKATNNRKYYITSLHIGHHPEKNFFKSYGDKNGEVFSKDGEFYSFRENKECDEDCISCAMNKLLGEIGNNFFNFIFLQQVKASNIDTSCYLKIYFNEKLKDGIKETNISLQDNRGKNITNIPDTIEIFCAKFPKNYFFEILDINWALTYLLLKFCNFFGESDYIELYREMNFEKNTDILEKVGKRNINDTFVSTSISSPVFRAYSDGNYDYFYIINCEKYLCIFNYFLSNTNKSLLYNHEQEFGLLSVNKNFERMFKDNNNDIGLDLPDNIKTKLDEAINKINGNNKWLKNAFKESFKGNAYVNLKKYLYLKDLSNDKDALGVYNKCIEGSNINIKDEMKAALKIPYFSGDHEKKVLDLSDIIK